MVLPVKLAASLPIGIAFIGGLLVSLTTPEGRAVHPVYGFPGAFLIAFFAAAAALLLVMPNAVGALLANRSGSGALLTFAAIFSGAVILVAVAQIVALSRIFRTPSPVLDFADWRLYAVLLADIAVMLGVAAWSGRNHA